ncbi:hypothetical protein NBRC116493_22830 [Aurantivibrio infirmus]
METYRIVFWGQISEGRNRSEVLSAFAKTFKVTDAQQLKKLFSGRVTTLKKNLSSEHAHRYVSVLQDMGCICRLESEFKDYFFETEFKQRNSVNFLQKEFDVETLSLTPKE